MQRNLDAALRCLVLGLFVIGGPVPADAQDEQLLPEYIAPVLPRIAKQPETPATREQIDLGRKLFFDKRLSRDNTVSCATCHDPKQGWSDGRPTSKGIGDQTGPRNSPTLINAVHMPLLFWDGRARSLEEQIREPIENPIEMNHSLPMLVGELNDNAEYRAGFKEAFGAEATELNLVGAIAAFVRTIKAGTAPFDRFRSGDKNALSPAAKRGHDVFFFRMNCSTCHRPPLFTDHEFHNLGVGIDELNPEASKDLGRFTVSQFTPDRRAFKTPTLRDIRRSAPYMHDGRFKTLEEVVDFYADGGVMNPQLDPLMNSIPLTGEEKVDLVVFLKEGLTSEKYPDGSSDYSGTSQTTRKPK